MNTLKIEHFTDPAFGQNAYLLWLPSERVGWMVDPGLQAEDVIARVKKLQAEPGGLSLERILTTHGHADHIAGNRQAKEAFPSAKLSAPAGEAHLLADAEANLSAGYGFPVTSPPADDPLTPGTTLTLETLRWQVLDVSGHSPAGLAFYCAEAGVCFTGDALFAGSIGRTDFPGSDHRRLLANIRNNLYTLPPDTRIYSGHGPPTTVEEERQTNPFCAG